MPPIEPIRTQRLILRDFVHEDWRAVHEYGSDPAVMRYTGEQPYSEDAALAFVVKRIAEQAASPRERYELAIELAETRDMIGTAGARWIRADRSEASIGYILRRDCWGRGYATEAGRALLRLGFDGMRARRLLGICDIENTASTRDMDKLGMKLEGTHRQESWSVPPSE